MDMERGQSPKIHISVIGRGMEKKGATNACIHFSKSTPEAKKGNGKPQGNENGRGSVKKE